MAGYRLTVALPLLLSFVCLIAYRYTTDPFSALPYSLKPPPPLASNSLLLNATLHRSPLLRAPESLAVHPTDSSLWTGCYDGSIVRLTIEPAFRAEVVSHSGWAAVTATARPHDINLTSACSASVDPWLCGRPLGLLFRSSVELVVADGYHGLLSFNLVSGRWQSLWNDTVRDTNSVALDSGGDAIYFTSASARYRNHVVLYDAVSGHCSGSVWRYDFSTRAAELLADSLCFPNGVLVRSHRLIVAETDAARLLSIDVSSRPQQPHNTHTVSVVLDSDRLPCLPDNLDWDAHSSDTHYWLGCGGPIRSAGSFSLYDWLGPLPAVRRLIAVFVPHSLIGLFVPPQAMVARVHIVNDSWHELSDTLMDRRGERLHTTTSAVWRPADNRLYFTSFKKVRRSRNTAQTAIAQLNG